MAEIIAFRGSIAIVPEGIRSREELDELLPKLSVPQGLVWIKMNTIVRRTDENNVFRKNRRNFLWFTPTGLSALGKEAARVVTSAALDVGEEWGESTRGIDSLNELLTSLGLVLPARA